MFQRIKNFILKFSNFKKTTLLILLFFIATGIMLPMLTHGSVWTETFLDHWRIWKPIGFTLTETALEKTTGTDLDISKNIALSLATAIAFVTRFFLILSHNLLNWVISPSFVNVPFTSNYVVNIGWTMIRDFTNILFVLVLAIIALSSALRIKEYEIKKILPTLILIALLINFTPVICGFIIDASNIAMNTWLSQGLTSGGFMAKLGEQVALIQNASNETVGTRLGMTIVLSVFNSIGAFIFLLFALLFIFRYLALWILVIFSPLAFFAYILPQTQKIWSMWWKQFIQWCIIGIPAAIFINLTNVMIALMSNSIANEQSPFGNSANFFKFNSEELTGFSEILMFLMPKIFLAIGFFVSLQTSAIGADKIMGLAKSGGGAASKWLPRKIWGGVKPWIEEKIPARQAAGSITRGWEKIPVGRWFLPEKLKKYAEFGAAIKEDQKEHSSYSSMELAHRITTGAIIGTKAAAAVKEIAGRGDMQDLINNYKKKYKEENDDDLFQNQGFIKDIGRKLEVANMGGELSYILRRDPRLARIAVKAKVGSYGNLTEDKAVDKVIGEKLKDEHVKDMAENVFKDKAVVESFMKHKGKSFYRTLHKNNPQAQEDFLNTLDKIYSIDIKEASDERKEELNKAYERYKEVIKDSEVKSEGWREFGEPKPEETEETAPKEGKKPFWKKLKRGEQKETPSEW